MVVRKGCFTHRKISIKLALGGLFVFATLFTASIAIGFQYYFSKQLATENALTTYSSMSTMVNTHIRFLDTGASNVGKILAKIGSSPHYQRREEDIKKIFTEVLSNNPIFYSIYIASDNDDFFQVINLDASLIIREKLNADKNDRWVLVQAKGEGSQRIKTFSYYSDDFALRDKTTAATTYYPSQRPWFLQAQENVSYKTNPYFFQYLQITGQTYSIKVENTDKVIGIDIVLSSMSDALVSSSLGSALESNQEGFIYKDSGEVIASNWNHSFKKADIESVPLKLTEEEKALVQKRGKLKVSNQMDWLPIDYAVAGKPEGYAIELLEIVSEMTGLKFKFINGFSWNELVEEYQKGEIDLLHSILKIDNNLKFERYSEPMYQLPVSIVTKQTDIKIERLDQLNDKALAVVKDWSVIPKLKQGYPRVDIVIFDTIKEALSSVVSGRTDAVIGTTLTLGAASEQYVFSDLTFHQNVSILGWNGNLKFFFTMKKEDQAVINLINRAIQNISLAQRSMLEDKWNGSYHLTVKDQERDLLVPYPELVTLANSEGLQGQLIQKDVNGVMKYFYVSAINENEYFGVVIPNELIYSEVNEKLYASILLTMIVMVLFIPFAWFLSGPVVKPIRLLQKETIQIKNGNYDQVLKVDSYIKEVWDLSVSVDDMVKELIQHEKNQEEFVESFIQLIAQAIDDKSPYTAGHCNRVPILGMMLAKAAETSKRGILKDFVFLNEDERREFRIAAWLHDCGKITTPEHIIDKGTKLEANYNRIHEIRMRFEVLWRDAEIEYYKAVQEMPNNESELRKQKELTQKELRQEFEFVATCNVGQEFMSEEAQDKIHLISKKEWLRFFDDTLGLSPAEELAIDKSTVTLPIKEQLLSDKPYHQITRVRSFEINPEFGIKMEVPELQYNLGEIYNLCIERGTLTPEDRFKINEHMISTIKMLESLPFPPKLARVPRYASTHHETLKGTGYPRKLSAKDVSVPERILVLADIFEALTASDRPYKKAKPVSVAIEIMHQMVVDEYIDEDVFKLFIESGLYIEYAKTYLPEAQLDTVDITKYL